MTRYLLVSAVLLASAVQAQGMLIPTDASLRPLGIKYQRVSAEIVEGTAVTKVEQVFVNQSPRQLEAQYVFPLPKGAVLQDFYLWINGQRTKGELLEKQKATDIYEGIVRRLQDPGLLEYVDTDAFRVRVFPVPANGEQRIELSFSQVLDFSSGVYQYHYPLGASARGAPPLQVKQDFTFSAHVTSKTPLRSIYSPTHKLGVSRKGEGEAIAGLELGAGTDISKDLDLFYTVSDKAIGLNFLSYHPAGDEPGFFTALISPKTELKADEVMAKRITFVMDTSGSMMGERIKLARQSLTYCVTRLNPRDEFNVIRFSTDVESLFEHPQPATEANVKKATAFIDSLEAIGGTAIDEAMLRALKDAEGRGDRPHLVMFVTDGNPTVGDTDESVIAAHAKAANKGSRVFTFGVGEDLNARLLDRVAEEGHGTSDFVRDGREFEVKVSGFYDKVANPVLADVSLDLSAFGAYDVYPRHLPDLFKGGQLVVMGRYRTPKDGTVVLKGSVNGKAQVNEYRAVATADSKTYDFVPRLWAIRKVGYLLEEIRLHGERAELKDEVVALGKKYGIVTPYTSYLVVEDTPMPVANSRPRPMPEDRFVPMGGSGSGFGGPARSGLPAPATVAPAPPPMEERAMDKTAFEAVEGKGAIAMAKRVRAMKDEDHESQADDGAAALSAAGRTFLSKSGAWVDSEVPAGARTVKVKYLSDAYFALVRGRSDLKTVFALGSRLTVSLGHGLVLVVDPDAGETRADAVGELLKAR